MRQIIQLFKIIQFIISHPLTYQRKMASVQKFIFWQISCRLSQNPRVFRLLLSKSHNCSIGNKPFKVKRDDYTYLAQQREIQSMITEGETWTRDLIQKRKEKIIEFVKDL